MPMKLIGGINQWVEPYDKSLYYSSGLLSGSSITLPEGETYEDDEARDILILFNHKIAEADRDFRVIGTGKKTQIQTIYNLPEDTIVRIKKI